MKSRRALIGSYLVPRDDRDGGSRRLLDLMLLLREAGYAIDFVAANGLGNRRSVRALQRLGVAVHDDSQRYTSSGAHVRSTVFEDLARSANFELALLAFWPVASWYLPIVRRVSPGTYVIVDSVDLHFLRIGRQSLHNSIGRQRPALLDAEFGLHLTAELNTYLAADAVLTVSQKEADLLGDLSGGSLLAAPVDAEDMPPSPLCFANRAGILLLGSFEHRPNVDALQYFCREILPRIEQSLLARHPVYVVGTGPTEQVRSITEGLDNVKLVGWVPSVAPYFHQTRISIVPLQYGAGTKRKMIQALMSETPTVSTSIGTEGLSLHDEEHVLIADDAERFARAIERLLQDENIWLRLATTGRSHILQTHGRTAMRDQLTRVLEAVSQRDPKPEMLAECSRDEYDRRICYSSGNNSDLSSNSAASYSVLVQRVRQFAECSIPAEATVVVISKGDDALLDLAGRRGWHFPQTATGTYAGYYPADSLASINHLETLRHRGGDYLIIPCSAFWWLEHYEGFAQHLDRQYRRIVDDPETCVIYALRDDCDVKLPAAEFNAGARGNGHGRPCGEDPLSLDVLTAADGAQPNGGPVEGRQPAARLIAFYLPQFHPIPENDRWWGEGFTEWRNVATAKSLFPGHHQPQLPTELGFYDLRCPETREDQAGLARQHGIHGFCYYHYWFNGKRLLERPFNEVLHSGTPNFPFCLCWANEPWSRRWDGSETDVLQSQSYSSEDDLNHIRWLLKPLSDPRAIAIDGRPVFLVYRADQLPNPSRTTDIWRTEAERSGLIGLYLIAVETGWDAGWDATRVGFDAKLLFQPQFSILSSVKRLHVPTSRLRCFDYEDAWPVLARPDPVPYLRYDTVFPSWDNTPRRGEEGWVLHNSTPEAYEKWLRFAVERTMARPSDQRVVFINAWNEWAEGAHLEPDRGCGRSYLDATGRALTYFRDTPHSQRLAHASLDNTRRIIRGDRSFHA